MLVKNRKIRKIVKNIKNSKKSEPNQAYTIISFQLLNWTAIAKVSQSHRLAARI